LSTKEKNKMGKMSATGMAEMVSDHSVTLEAALHWHLTSNHFPSHPAWMVPVALRAIQKARKGEWHKGIRLPGIATFKGIRMPLVGDLIVALHLEDFI
jgi:hypothetical protein